MRLWDPPRPWTAYGAMLLMHTVPTHALYRLRWQPNSRRLCLLYLREASSKMMNDRSTLDGRPGLLVGRLMYLYVLLLLPADFSLESP